MVEIIDSVNRLNRKRIKLIKARFNDSVRIESSSADFDVIARVNLFGKRLMNISKDKIFVYDKDGFELAKQIAELIDVKTIELDYIDDIKN